MQVGHQVMAKICSPMEVPVPLLCLQGLSKLQEATGPGLHATEGRGQEMLPLTFCPASCLLLAPFPVPSPRSLTGIPVPCC